MAASLRDVRSPRYGGPVLLRLSSSHFDPSATWAGSADQLAVPADDSTVAFMRLKRAVDAVDETLPDSGRVEQMLPNVAERKRRLKEQVRIRDVDGQIASEC